MKLIDLKKKWEHKWDRFEPKEIKFEEIKLEKLKEKFRVFRFNPIIAMISAFTSVNFYTAINDYLGETVANIWFYAFLAFYCFIVVAYIIYVILDIIETIKYGLFYWGTIVKHVFGILLCGSLILVALAIISFVQTAFLIIGVPVYLFVTNGGF